MDRSQRRSVGFVSIEDCDDASMRSQRHSRANSVASSSSLWATESDGSPASLGSSRRSSAVTTPVGATAVPLRATSFAARSSSIASAGVGVAAASSAAVDSAERRLYVAAHKRLQRSGGAREASKFMKQVITAAALHLPSNEQRSQSSSVLHDTYAQHERIMALQGATLSDRAVNRDSFSTHARQVEESFVSTAQFLVSRYVRSCHAQEKFCLTSPVDHLSLSLSDNGTASREGSSPPTNPPAVLLSVDALLDVESMAIIKVWQCRREARRFQSALRFVAQAKRDALVPNPVHVPYSVCVAHQCALVTVTWLPPLLHEDPVKLRTDSLVSFAVGVLRAALGHQPDSACGSEEELPIFVGADGRLYVMAVDEVPTHTLNSTSAILTDRSPARRYEHLITEQVLDRSVDMASPDLVVRNAVAELNLLINKHPHVLAFKLTPRNLTEFLHLQGVNMQFLARFLEGADAESVSCADPAAKDALRRCVTSQLVARAARSLIEADVFKVTFTASANFGKQQQQEEEEELNDGEVLEEEKGGPLENTCASSPQGAPSASVPWQQIKDLVFRVAAQRVKKLLKRSTIANALVPVIRSKFGTPHSFTLDLDMVVLRDVISLVCQKLALHWDSESKSVTGFASVPPLVSTTAARDLAEGPFGRTALASKISKTFSRIQVDCMYLQTAVVHSSLSFSTHFNGKVTLAAHEQGNETLVQLQRSTTSAPRREASRLFAAAALSDSAQVLESRAQSVGSPARFGERFVLNEVSLLAAQCLGVKDAASAAFFLFRALGYLFASKGAISVLSGAQGATGPATAADSLNATIRSSASTASGLTSEVCSLKKSVSFSLRKPVVVAPLPQQQWELASIVAATAYKQLSHSSASTLAIAGSCESMVPAGALSLLFYLPVRTVTPSLQWHVLRTIAAAAAPPPCDRAASLQWILSAICHLITSPRSPGSSDPPQLKPSDPVSTFTDFLTLRDLADSAAGVEPADEADRAFCSNSAALPPRPPQVRHTDVEGIVTVTALVSTAISNATGRSPPNEGESSRPAPIDHFVCATFALCAAAVAQNGCEGAESRSALREVLSTLSSIRDEVHDDTQCGGGGNFYPLLPKGMFDARSNSPVSWPRRLPQAADALREDAALRAILTVACASLAVPMSGGGCPPPLTALHIRLEPHLKVCLAAVLSWCDEHLETLVPLRIKLDPQFAARHAEREQRRLAGEAALRESNLRAIAEALSQCCEVAEPTARADEEAAALAALETLLRDADTQRVRIAERERQRACEAHAKLAAAAAALQTLERDDEVAARAALEREAAAQTLEMMVQDVRLSEACLRMHVISIEQEDWILVSNRIIAMLRESQAAQGLAETMRRGLEDAERTARGLTAKRESEAWARLSHSLHAPFTQPAPPPDPVTRPVTEAPVNEMSPFLRFTEEEARRREQLACAQAALMRAREQEDQERRAAWAAREAQLRRQIEEEKGAADAEAARRILSEEAAKHETEEDLLRMRRAAEEQAHEQREREARRAAFTAQAAAESPLCDTGLSPACIRRSSSSSSSSSSCGGGGARSAAARGGASPARKRNGTRLEEYQRLYRQYIEAEWHHVRRDVLEGEARARRRLMVRHHRDFGVLKDPRGSAWASRARVRRLLPRAAVISDILDRTEVRALLYGPSSCSKRGVKPHHVSPLRSAKALEGILPGQPRREQRAASCGFELCADAARSPKSYHRGSRRTMTALGALELSAHRTVVEARRDRTVISGAGLERSTRQTLPPLRQ